MAIRAELFVGVDVQLSRGCPVVAIDREGRFVCTAWLEAPADASSACLAQVAGRLRSFVLGLSEHHGCGAAVGIDAPRQPLPAPRAHYWQGLGDGGWRASRAGDRGLGRHCEVVVSALSLARPQWTPLATRVPDWMALGVACFEAIGQLAPRVEVHEIFPTASYRLFDDRGPRIEMSFAGFGPGPRDMLDAYCGAATVREFALGRGWEAGGGDGYGTIVLPGARRSPESAVHQWPAGPEPTP